MCFSGGRLREKGLGILIRGHSLESWHSALPIRNGLGGTICLSSPCLLGFWRTEPMVPFSYASGFILWLVNTPLCLCSIQLQTSTEHLHQDTLRALLNQMNEIQSLTFSTLLPPITTTCTTSKLVEHPVSPHLAYVITIGFIAKPLLLPHPLYKVDLSLYLLNAFTTCPDDSPAMLISTVVCRLTSSLDCDSWWSRVVTHRYISVFKALRLPKVNSSQPILPVLLCPSCMMFIPTSIIFVLLLLPLCSPLILFS